MFGNIVLKKLPGSASLLTHCKGFSRKIPNLNAVSMIKRMIFADGKHQTVINNRENGKVRRKNFTLYNSNVKFSAQKFLLNVLGITHIRMDVDIRKVLLKFRNQERSEAGSDCNRRTKFQNLRLSLIQHKLLNLPELLNQTAGLRKQKSATFCEVKLFTETFKEKSIVMFFQLTDCLTYGGLR